MKNLIFLLLSIVSINITQGQPPLGNVAITNTSISPAPSSVGGISTLGFTVTYDGLSANAIPLNGFGPFTIATDPLVINVTLNNMVPSGLPASSITITGPGGFTSSYNAVMKVYKLTQTQPIPDDAGISVAITATHTTASPQTNPQNGFLAQAEIPAYLTDNAPGDNSTFTYTYTTLVLPLRLQNFAGSSKQCTNTLTWKSTEEKNLQSIEVESSEDGASFRMVGSVVPKNIAGVHDYSYVDEANTAKVFYRLKIIDLDGRVVYSDVIRLNTLCKQPSASMFPNPMNATTDGTVVLKNFAGKITAHLQYMGGKQLATIRMLNGSNIINLSKYAQGTYLLKVVDENLQTQTLKIVTYK